MPLFEAPVGPDQERNTGIVWPSEWVDANPFNPERTYQLRRGVFAYHTGADLNLRRRDDNMAPVYAIGDGTVTYADIWHKKGVWGGIVIINHGLVDFIENGIMVKKPVFSRYAHVQAISPEIFRRPKGTPVKKGQPIARIGGADLGFDPHLHFDISTTNILDSRPGFWPGLDIGSLLQHFVNPLTWLRNAARISVVAQPAPDNVDAPAAPESELRYAQFEGAQVRDHHSISAKVVFELKKGAELPLLKQGKRLDGFIWGEICGGEFNGHWVAVFKEDEKKLLFDTKKPA